MRDIRPSLEALAKAGPQLCHKCGSKRPLDFNPITFEYGCLKCQRASPACCGCGRAMQIDEATNQRTCQTCGVAPEWLKKLGVTEGQWQYVVKNGLQAFMRTGMTLRTRVGIALMALSQGYRGELCMIQVGPDEFGPVTPTKLATYLEKITGIEFARSGHKLDASRRRLTRIRGASMRKILASIEIDDGMITRVKALCPPRMLFDLTFDEALSRGMIVPLLRLPDSERKKGLNGKCFIYFHANPRPATLEALLRRGDDEVLGDPKEKTAEEAVKGLLRGPQQMAFRLLLGDGIASPDLAVKVSSLDEYQARWTMFYQAEENLKAAKKSLEEFTRRKGRELQGEQPNRTPHPDQTQLFEPAAGAVEPNDSDSKVSAKSNPASAVSVPVLPPGAGRVVESPPDPHPGVLASSAQASAAQGSAEQKATPLVSRPQSHRRATNEELQPLRVAMIGIAGRADMQKVKYTFAHSRDHCFDCTVEEVTAIALEAGERMKRVRKRIENPLQYLSDSIIAEFEGGIAEWRKQRAQAQRKPAAVAVAPLCPKCKGHGFLGGVEWKDGEQAVKALKAGAQFCDCEEGEIARLHAGATRERSAS